jgi:hypothetical protein
MHHKKAEVAVTEYRRQNTELRISALCGIFFAASTPRGQQCLPGVQFLLWNIPGEASQFGSAHSTTTDKKTFAYETLIIYYQSARDCFFRPDKLWTNREHCGEKYNGYYPRPY